MPYRHTAPRWPWLIPLALLLTGCRSPTEIELVLSTDVPCTSFKGVAISAYSTEDAAESLSPWTVGLICHDDGSLGTMFVTPAGDRDQPLFIRTTVGINIDPTLCTADDPERHCIVARRRLAFVPHEHLTLPIALETTCAGRTCQASETCAQGVCIDAALDPHACNADPARCDLPAPGGSAGQARARAEKQLAKARAETRSGAQFATATRGKAAQGAPAAPLDHHDDCDCSTVSGCACSCMLTFFPGRNAPLFAAQHTLASVYLAPPLLPPARRQVSRLFRPPIA